ncbi:MAG TPA: hypothetical protein VMF13_17395 [Luteitalea sp.]|nr:hypothetical protein [Luteitalea sp.]
MKMHALLEGKRYYAAPHDQGVLLFSIDGTGDPISVAYSDNRLQLEPSWWQWNQPSHSPVAGRANVTPDTATS